MTTHHGDAHSLRILFLAEGNPEDPSASGSGTPASVIRELRALGAHVDSADVELYGLTKRLAQVATWAPRRSRWVAKYHLAPRPYHMRSARAAAAVRAVSPDVVLQYGGTFGVPPELRARTFLYCDSHTALSKIEPKSWGAALNERQLAAAVDCQRRVYEAATGIFTFSDFVRSSFLREYRLSPNDVITVHAGPNFDPSTAPSPGRRARRPGHRPAILFVGREFERKGGPVLLDAFRRVRQSIPDCRLLIVGPKELEIDEAGVEFLGYLRKSDPADAARLREAYAEADVFCLPTRHEPFGIVVLEAMFNGLPVVATNIWAIPEMVVHGETGFTIERDDSAALADRLVQILSDPDLARRLGDAGRARAEANFTWRAVATKMLRAMSRSRSPREGSSITSR